MQLDWRVRRCVEMFVVPPVADYWLQHHNPFNRIMRPSAVEAYASDLKSGRFALTHQGIAFDWNGHNIDGQHRLKAIVVTGIGATLFVTTGLDPLVRAVVDTHAKRTTADAMVTTGRGQRLGRGSNTSAGMWTRMMVGISGSKSQATRSQTVEFSDRYAEAGEWVMRQLERYPRVRSVETAPVMAAIARAYYHYQDNLSRLERFVRVMSTGIQNDSDDVTAVHWRNKLINGEVRGNSNVAGDIYGKTCRAIQGFMRREVVTRFVCPAEEPFPLPRTTSEPRLIDRVAGEYAGARAGGSGIDRVAQSARG